MNIRGPDRYRLSFDATSFTVLCASGTPRFSGIATSPKPKLYIASVDNWPIYVGVTKQPMRTRLRIGWNADGTGGYHGYAWRSRMSAANLDIWCHEDAPEQRSSLDMEILEAEVVFLIRGVGQWPLHQTEIHFHPSNDEHRAMARQILSQYGALPTPLSS